MLRNIWIVCLDLGPKAGGGSEGFHGSEAGVGEKK